MRVATPTGLKYAACQQRCYRDRATQAKNNKRAPDGTSSICVGETRGNAISDHSTLAKGTRRGYPPPTIIIY